MFSYNKFKTELIQKKVPDSSLTSVYRIGDFIDLCTGPHISHTGLASAFKLMKHSATYWQADASKESLQRIYGISFAEKQELKDFLH